MDEDIYPDELYHYGRKGMKWGQHIFGKERSSGTKKRKKSSEDVENRFVSGAKKVAGKVSAARAKAKEDKRVQKLKKKKMKLIKCYKHHAVFESEKGIRQSYRYWDIGKLLLGQPR